MNDTTLPNSNLIDRLFNFGVPTGLLCALIYYGSSILSAIDSGYQHNAKELLKSAQVYERTTDRLMTHLLEDRRTILELAKRSTEAVEEIKSSQRALESAHNP